MMQKRTDYTEELEETNSGQKKKSVSLNMHLLRQPVIQQPTQPMAAVPQQFYAL